MPKGKDTSVARSEWLKLAKTLAKLNKAGDQAKAKVREQERKVQENEAIGG